MILDITMKTPDAINDAINDAIGDGAIDKNQADTIHRKLSKWFEYGEYATIRINTDTMTARVLETSEYD